MVCEGLSAEGRHLPPRYKGMVFHYLYLPSAHRKIRIWSNQTDLLNRTANSTRPSPQLASTNCSWTCYKPWRLATRNSLRTNCSSLTSSASWISGRLPSCYGSRTVSRRQRRTSRRLALGLILFLIPRLCSTRKLEDFGALVFRSFHSPSCMFPCVAMMAWKRMQAYSDS